MAHNKTTFPFGTMVVNLTGSFLLGIIFVLTVERFMLSPNYRIFLGIGFIGAYTTFSTLSLETVKLLESSSFLLAFVNAVGSLSLGLVAVFLGIVLGRLI